MQILDGRKLSSEKTLALKERISTLDRTPRLDIFLVGSNPSSEKYVLMKQKKAEEVGIKLEVHKYDEDISEEKIIEKIKDLNHDDNVDGVMVQLPLPSVFDEEKILNAISIKKDVDGLTAENLGKLFRNEDTFISATAKAVRSLIDAYNIEVEGKHSVIIGRSKEVGLPVSAVMLSKNSTVTICHSHTANLKDICRQADILISCMGHSKFITKEYIRKGAVVIDIGFNIDLETGKSTGDVDTEGIEDLVSYISPVPGGVGPVTIISLLENVVKAYEERNS